jgi:hypothetical protein
VGVAATEAEGLGDGTELADGEVLCDGGALCDGEVLCDGVELGCGLVVEPGPGTHPASPSVPITASATRMTVDRSRGSAMLFIMRSPLVRVLPSSPSAVHLPVGRASVMPDGDR